MKQVLSYLFLGALVCVAIVILFPTGRPRWQTRRSSCQSNLKQIGISLRQYAQDNDGQLPSGRWGVPVAVYAKTSAIFQCPETPDTRGTGDYFFNAHLMGTPLKKISSPLTLIWMGDGQSDAPLDTTLFSLPEAWRTDENSPAWRHGGTANYLFVDGHVKALKVNRVNRDFGVVNR